LSVLPESAVLEMIAFALLFTMESLSPFSKASHRSIIMVLSSEISSLGWLQHTNAEPSVQRIITQIKGLAVQVIE
jgi:hypothetical protein